MRVSAAGRGIGEPIASGIDVKVTGGRYMKIPVEEEGLNTGWWSCAAVRTHGESEGGSCMTTNSVMLGDGNRNSSLLGMKPH
jgi:hypothetical protein